MPHFSQKPPSGLCPKLHAPSGMGTVPLWGVETPESGQPWANPCGAPRTKRRRPCPEGADSPHTHTHTHIHSHAHSHTHVHTHTHLHTSTALTLSQVELPGPEDHIFIHGHPEGSGNREESGGAVWKGYEWRREVGNALSKDSPEEHIGLVQTEPLFQGCWGEERAEERFSGRFRISGRAKAFGVLWGTWEQENL